MASKKARATAVAQAQHSASAVRTWTFTIAISATLLAVMYGLAYWHELRGAAARQDAMQSAPISATH
jgi:hypothetical protein